MQKLLGRLSAVFLNLEANLSETVAALCDFYMTTETISRSSGSQSSKHLCIFTKKCHVEWKAGITNKKQIWGLGDRIKEPLYLEVLNSFIWNSHKVAPMYPFPLTSGHKLSNTKGRLLIHVIIWLKGIILSGEKKGQSQRLHIVVFHLCSILQMTSQRWITC